VADILIMTSDDFSFGQEALGQNGFLHAHEAMRVVHMLGEDCARRSAIAGTQGGHKTRLVIQS
jgi:hypothetical protein